MESTEDLVGISADRLTALVAYGVLGLLALFILLGLVRLWGLRAQKRGRSAAALDLEALKRQRDAGEITPEEYEAIYTRLSGIAPGGDAAGQPIKGTGDAGERRKGSTDGET